MNAIIDLHGIKHEQVSCIIQSICSEHAVPFVVITGKSDLMKKIVLEAVKIFGYSIRETIDNPGRVVVYESR